MLRGKSEIINDISFNLLETVANNNEHLRTMRDLDARSALVVPLVARGRTLGVIMFVAAESGRIPQ